MVVLILAAIAGGIGYYISLRIWPQTKCGRCSGGGHNAGSTSKRFGMCKGCGGTGRKPRRGTRMINRRGRS